MSKVLYYTTKVGGNPVKKFIESLQEKQQRKIIRILTQIQIYGLVTAIPHTKKLTGTSLWEIRILGKDNLRVLYVTVLDDSILLLNGFSKKAAKTPLKEIDVALLRLKDWLQIKNQH